MEKRKRVNVVVVETMLQGAEKTRSEAGTGEEEKKKGKSRSTSKS